MLSVSRSLRSIAAGAVAGAAGTVAMDLLLYARYRSGGGKQDPLGWETAAGVQGWDTAPAPAKVARKMAHVLGYELPDHAVRSVTNLMHWGYGTGWGTLLGAARAGGVGGGPARGAIFGGIVWGFDYVALPAMGIYQPIWEYDAEILWKDLSAHLVYGAVAGTIEEVLAG